MGPGAPFFGILWWHEAQEPWLADHRMALQAELHVRECQQHARQGRRREKEQPGSASHPKSPPMDVSKCRPASRRPV